MARCHQTGGDRAAVKNIEQLPGISDAMIVIILRSVLTVVLFTVCVAGTASLGQHGTPMGMRVMTPTIRDADPGALPAKEEDVLPDVYRRQPVSYRTGEPPGTIIIDTS